MGGAYPNKPAKTDTFRREQKRLTDAQAAAIDRIKSAADDLKAAIDAAGGEPRSTAVAITNLEQSVMWAVKGISA